MKTSILLLSLLSLSCFASVSYTESSTYIGTIRYYTVKTPTKTCVYDYLVEKHKVLNKYCFTK